MLFASTLIAALASSPQGTSAPRPAPTSERDPTTAEVNDAIDSFSNALPSIQEQIAGELAAAVAAAPSSGVLATMLARARKEIVPVARGATPVHDPKQYASNEFARGRAPQRTPADPASTEAAEKRGQFRPWDNQPYYAAHVLWSMARDAALDWGGAIAPAGQLHNALNGYLPDSDLLVAWVTKQLDFDERYDADAEFFDYAYCDLSGRIYSDITLYDAWSSGNGMEMPDVDQIAFARAVLKDSSWTSPIPAGPRQTQLYNAIGDHFLAYFRYRVWIEAAANLYVNPEAALRDTHEGLRQRLLWLFASEGGDLDRIAKRLKAFVTRDKFIVAADDAIRADPQADAAILRFRQQRSAERWPVARAAYGVLRAHGMLPR